MTKTFEFNTGRGWEPITRDELRSDYLTTGAMQRLDAWVDAGEDSQLQDGRDVEWPAVLDLSDPVGRLRIRMV